MEINHMFDTDSKELTNYLNANKVGKQIAGPTGKIWNILEVKINTDIPPDPSTGHAVTGVSLIVG